MTKIKLPKKEEIVGKTQEQIEATLTAKYPELKAIRDVFINLLKKDK